MRELHLLSTIAESGGAASGSEIKIFWGGEDEIPAQNVVQYEVKGWSIPPCLRSRVSSEPEQHPTRRRDESSAESRAGAFAGSSVSG